ncbi:MAG: uracil-DNA glycosylase family protein [Chloroflexota bacterium]|nr:uracil-DNA glycosylase family protein [Chloroflexota bacterium]
MLESPRSPKDRLDACRLCLDAGYSVVSPPIFSGPDSASLMIVGQAPGRVETMQTRLPFSGPSGKRLFQWLAQAGWQEQDFRATSYMTAVTKCYPGPHANGRGDRVPIRAEQHLCRPWLEQELALVQPAVVLPVGRLAITRFIGGKVTLATTVGRTIERPADDPALTEWARNHLPAETCLVPLPHPSGASQWVNQPSNKELLQHAIKELSRLRGKIRNS